MTRATVYFVRHGETDWNAEHRLQGHHDIPLNAVGVAQALRCGALLRRLFDAAGRAPAHFDYVSSPLVRARSTMELIRETLDLPPRGYGVDRRLIEMSFGAWEGWTYSEVRARAPQALAARTADRWSFAPPGGETYGQVAARVQAWREQLSRDTVVAGHGEAGRALFMNLGAGAEEAPARLAQSAVYVFEDGAVTRHDALP